MADVPPIGPDTRARRKGTRSSMGPVIPESLIDAPTQRFYVAAAFMCLQAYKLWDFLQIAGMVYDGSAGIPDRGFYIVKWFVLDGFYIVTLPRLRIPWLTFSRRATAAQLVFMAAATVFAASSVRIPWTVVFGSLWRLVYHRELSLLGRQVNVDSIIHNKSSILGQYTVRVLPEAYSKLDTNELAYCVGSGRREAMIPVMVNSSLPLRSLQLRRIDMAADDEVTLLNFTGRRLKSMIVHEEKAGDKAFRTTQLSIPVSAPGVYELSQVLDKSNLPTRIYAAQATVVDCPKAEFVQSKHSSAGTMCYGDTDELVVSIHGVAPLRFTYGWKSSNGDSGSNTHEDITSSLMVQSRVSSSLRERVPVRPAGPGDWWYYLDSVTDALGNKVDYGLPNEPAKHSSHAKLLKVESPAAIAFEGCDIERPLKMLRNQQINIPLKITTSLAANRVYQMSFEYTGANQDLAADAATPATFNATIDARRPMLTIRDAGLYTLVSAYTGRCNCEIRASNSCPIIIPPEPSVTVDFQPIQDRCVGSVGLVAELDFIGTPPFDVTYKEIFNKNQVQMRSVRVLQNRHQLRFTPSVAGHYAYQFIGLRDSNYGPFALSGSEYYMEKQIYPKAMAKFADSVDGKLEMRGICLGSRVSLPVDLSGSGPWSLKYEVIHGTQRQKLSMDNIASDRVSLDLPELDQGGVYLVQLVSVQDSNDCPSLLDGSHAMLEVRREKPYASFGMVDGKTEIEVPEPVKARLPLRLTGRAPWIVEYVNKATGETESEQINDANGFLLASNEGEYVLQDVRDAECVGFPRGQIEMSVKHLKKPSLSLKRSQDLISLGESGSSSLTKASGAEYQLAEVCEGGSNTLTLGIHGHAPFVVDYEVESYDERNRLVGRESKQITSTSTSVKFATGKKSPGIYRYRVTGISDMYYKIDTFDLEGYESPTKGLSFVQKVTQNPRVVFLHPRKTYRVCDQSVEGCRGVQIPVVFRGVPPFSLSLEIFHILTGTQDVVSFSGISTLEYNLTLPEHALPLGTHQLRLRQVHDSRGCPQDLNSEAGVTVLVSELPSVSDRDVKSEYCVGDRISYALVGQAPFSITYRFNDVEKISRVDGNTFSRIAAQPGTFELVTVSDVASGIAADIGLRPVPIHNLPSVKIGQGLNVVEDINEGDRAELKFEFTGTPPFAFTYTRNEDKGGKPGKVLETHSVTGIKDYSYSIFSSSGGVYMVHRVSDAHCHACPSCSGPE